MLREGLDSKRCLLLCGLSVVCYANVRGRSRSRKLIKLQQQIVGEVLYRNVYIGMLPVSSAENPSDDPSRGLPVREPPQDPPAWAAQFVAGQPPA